MYEIDEEGYLQQERLNNMSSFRIYPNEINVTSSGPRKGGGKAEVAQATFKRRMWSRKKQVAVKKLRYHEGMDKHMFSNVGMIIFVIHYKHLPHVT